MNENYVEFLYDMYLLKEEEGLSEEEIIKKLKIDSSYNTKEMFEIVEKNKEEYKKLTALYRKEFKKRPFDLSLEELRIIRDALSSCGQRSRFHDNTRQDLLKRIRDKVEELENA